MAPSVLSIEGTPCLLFLCFSVQLCNWVIDKVHCTLLVFPFIERTRAQPFCSFSVFFLLFQHLVAAADSHSLLKSLSVKAELFLSTVTLCWPRLGWINLNVLYSGYLQFRRDHNNCNFYSLKVLNVSRLFLVKPKV